MKIKTATQITDFSNEPLMDGDKPLTIGDVIQRGVLVQVDSDRQRTGEDKAKLMQLALRANADEAEYSAEDIAKLKSRIGEVYAPIVVGRAFEILDPGT